MSAADQFVDVTAMLAAQRASIAKMIEDEGEKRRGRGVKRMARMLADAVRAGFDQADEPAPEGARARYNEEATHGSAA